MNITAIRISKLLKERNVSMYKLAKDFGCSKSKTFYWCEGKFEPKAKDIARLAIYFDVSSDYLLGLVDEHGNKNPDIVNSFNNNRNNTINIEIKK